MYGEFLVRVCRVGVDRHNELEKDFVNGCLMVVFVMVVVVMWANIVFVVVLKTNGGLLIGCKGNKCIISEGSIFLIGCNVE